MIDIVTIIQDGPIVASIDAAIIVPAAGNTAAYDDTAIRARLDAVEAGLADLPAGAAGASAYEVAVSSGFAGTESDWLGSLVGPEGADGADGAAGPQGDAGPAGAKGDPGIQGPQGVAGADGVAGAQGPKGDQGPAGAKGDAGAQGPQGLPGADGAAGAQGLQGAQGAKGDAGAQGPQGVQGPAGTNWTVNTVTTQAAYDEATPAANQLIVRV